MRLGCQGENVAWGTLGLATPSAIVDAICTQDFGVIVTG